MGQLAAERHNAKVFAATRFGRAIATTHYDWKLQTRNWETQTP
jgi:hypothetical protein